MSEEFKEWFRANGRLDIDNYRDAMTHNLEIWEASRQQMLKEVLEVVENIAMYEPTFDPTRSMRYSPNGEWICPINLKDELTKKFSASDEA